MTWHLLIVHNKPFIGELGFDNGDAVRFAELNCHLCLPNIFWLLFNCCCNCYSYRKVTEKKLLQKSCNCETITMQAIKVVAVLQTREVFTFLKFSWHKVGGANSLSSNRVCISLICFGCSCVILICLKMNWQKSEWTTVTNATESRNDWSTGKARPPNITQSRILASLLS